MSCWQYKFEVYVDYEDGEPEATPQRGTKKIIQKYIQDALEDYRKNHELGEDYIGYMQVRAVDDDYKR